MSKGIIFDMDGTLWDSAPQVAESWNLAMGQCGYQRKPLTAADIQGVMGKTMDDIARLLFADADEEKRQELLRTCCQMENDYLREHGGRLYPKLRETLAALKRDYRLFIVSNCQAGYIEAFLDFYSLHDLVDDIQCYGDNGRPKADNIRIICERSRLEDAVYVGDIQGDYDASAAAGVKFIHAGYGFGTVDADVPEIQALEELVELVPHVLC
ncbi:MAG: HAD family hydrolase [Muribaculaceae bacterium]|nr:HAD family hydrolase [Roseburia sp.]MCM1431752.1 HAD family hydrolase [Muribaculaceae bacterium]MCM1493382.1 HAD family hydrolase [Muribaculaceae bacterium]